jgi:hypothetical protein
MADLQAALETSLVEMSPRIMQHLRVATEVRLEC